MFRIALIMLFVTYTAPSQACQPKLYANSVFDLEDGLHVFAMKFHDEASFEYPVSGVYRKGPDKNLVWEFSGIYTEFPLADRISANGRYFVATNFLFLDETVPGKTVVLSIYDQGNLIREFTRESFVDTETLNQYFFHAYVNNPYSIRCIPPSWAYLQYNKLDDQVKVRAVEKRTIVIDVPTAEILYVDEY